MFTSSASTAAEIPPIRSQLNNVATEWPTTAIRLYRSVCCAATRSVTSKTSTSVATRVRWYLTRQTAGVADSSLTTTGSSSAAERISTTTDWKGSEPCHVAIHPITNSTKLGLGTSVARNERIERMFMCSSNGYPTNLSRSTMNLVLFF